MLQQPGALIGFLVFAVPAFALARERVLVGSVSADSRIPRDLAHAAAMAALAVPRRAAVLYAHMGRLSLWDGPQWALYTASPAAPGAILRGKLQAALLFLLWPLVLVAAAVRTCSAPACWRRRASPVWCLAARSRHSACWRSSARCRG